MVNMRWQKALVGACSLQAQPEARQSEHQHALSRFFAMPDRAALLEIEGGAVVGVSFRSED